MGIKSRFKVYGRFNGKLEATVTIDRGNNLVSVRPHRMHKTYEMRLEDLAEVVIWRCIKEEIRAKKKAKAEAKKMRRAG